jgi:hypothetical protein
LLQSGQFRLDRTDPLTQGLISYWPLAGNTLDYGPGPRALTPNPAPLPQVIGSMGRALSFNGSTHYLTTGAVAGGTTPMSFVAWIVLNTTSGQQVILDGVSPVFVRLQYGGAVPNYLNGTFGNGGVWGTWVSPANPLVAGVPYFVGLECDNVGNQYLYVNGVQTGPVTGTPTSQYTGVQFGMQSGGGNYFGGLIFLAGVWRRMIGPAAHARLFANPYDLLRLDGRPVGEVIGGAAAPTARARAMVMA